MICGIAQINKTERVSRQNKSILFLQFHKCEAFTKCKGFMTKNEEISEMTTYMIDIWLKLICSALPP